MKQQATLAACMWGTGTGAGATSETWHGPSRGRAVGPSSVSKRGSSELACLEWLSGGLGCQTLPCLRFSGSLSERAGEGWPGMVRVCVHLLFCGVISGGRQSLGRSLARGKPQTTPAPVARHLLSPSLPPRPMTAEGYESSLSISSLLFPSSQPPHRIQRINMGRA